MTVSATLHAANPDSDRVPGQMGVQLLPGIGLSWGNSGAARSPIHKSLLS